MIKKGKSCQKGYGCGASCINVNYECLKDLPQPTSNLLTKVSGFIKKLIGRGGDSDESNPDAQDPFDAANKVKSVSEALNVSEEEANKMVRAISTYTGNGDQDMKDIMRGRATRDDYDDDEGDLFQDFKNKIGLVRDFIDKAPKYDGFVYRGIRNISDQKMSEALTTVGSEVEFDTFTSWSASKNVAKSFANDRAWDKNRGNSYMLKVKNSKGTLIQSLSKYKEEAEVLAPSNTRYRVKSVVEKRRTLQFWKKVRLIELEEVD